MIIYWHIFDSYFFCIFATQSIDLIVSIHHKIYSIQIILIHIKVQSPGGGTRSENWWGCAAGRWKLDPKRSREKWNLGPKRSNSLRIGSFNTPKDRFGVGGWEKIPQKDRARSCQSEKRGSKPRHICITHHIGSTPPGSNPFVRFGHLQPE